MCTRATCERVWIQNQCSFLSHLNPHATTDTTKQTTQVRNERQPHLSLRTQRVSKKYVKYSISKIHQVYQSNCNLMTHTSSMRHEWRPVTHLLATNVSNTGWWLAKQTLASLATDSLKTKLWDIFKNKTEHIYLNFRLSDYFWCRNSIWAVN